MNRGISLSITVATMGEEGISRIATNILPPIPEVEWVISWQQSEGIPVPEKLIREDVEIVRCNIPGLSANRNNAISYVRGKIVLISDDDVVYFPDGITSVISTFTSSPETDVACFKVVFPFKKIYPSSSLKLAVPLPKGYSVASVEIAARKDVAKKFPFNPLLGLGAPEFIGGEDEYFLLQCIRSGCNCSFIDKEICRHPSVPTGFKSLSRGNLRASGCLIAKTYPISFPARIILKAFRISRNRESGFLSALLQLSIGAFHSRKIR